MIHNLDQTSHRHHISSISRISSVFSADDDLKLRGGRVDDSTCLSRCCYCCVAFIQFQKFQQSLQERCSDQKSHSSDANQKITLLCGGVTVQSQQTIGKLYYILQQLPYLRDICARGKQLASIQNQGKYQGRGNLKGGVNFLMTTTTIIDTISSNTSYLNLY